MQFFFKGQTLPVFSFPKVERLKTGEVLYERQYLSPRPPPKISLRHDHNLYQREWSIGFYNWTAASWKTRSIEQQPVGKLVQQSCGEVQHATFSQLTQPKPKPICDRSGETWGHRTCFVDKERTTHSQEIVGKRLHKELGSSDRSGKLEKLSANTRVKQAHDGTGQPVKRNSSSAHTVEEQFVPEENCDIASFNTDNEFNRATNEENIDLNIPGLPHSAVKQSHDVNVQNLIQKIENHPQRQALQSDLQQHRQFNPFSKKSQDVIKASGNTELCELLDVELKAQCKECLTYWDVDIVCCTCGRALFYEMIRQRTKSTSSQFLTFSLFRTFTSGRADHTVTGTERNKAIKKITLRINSKRSVRNDNSWAFTIDLFVTWFRKTMLELGRTEEVIREMDKVANETTPTLLQKRNSTCTVAIGGYVRILWFRHDAHKASSWLQKSVVNFASSQECEGLSLLSKLVANLFLILVAMVRFLVASLTATMDLTLMERGICENQWMVFFLWNEFHNDLVQQLQWLNSATANAVYSHRRGV